MDVFSASGYKTYIIHRLDDKTALYGGRGSRAKLSRAIGCQTAYTAQVLKGAGHFSLEQGELINEFLSHSAEESAFFLTLLQRDRAGTPKLKKRMDAQLRKLRDERMVLKNRLYVNPVLNEVDQTLFYSSWAFAAIHALVSIPEYQKGDVAPRIAERLRINVGVVKRALEFLEATGMLKRDGSRLKIGGARTHLASDSPLISKHHMNWRVKTLQHLEAPRAEDLHYSSVVSLSVKDAQHLQEEFLRLLENSGKTIADSPEETLRVFNLDFFEI